ncbi:MAG: prolyl oligopeptidase family serine peptidase, partial [Acidimicrobiales bacterium]
PSASWIGPNPEPTSSTLRYEYSSMVTPRTVLDMDLRARESVVRKRQRVLGGYDPERYVSERLWATAPDGTEVPISVLRRRDTPLDGSAPCLLYGYGAYEVSIDPVFSSVRLSLVDRGFVHAIAHVRGGGELGRHWYDEGKMLNKANTFSDFIACARHLVDTRWTSAGRVVARGASAGGLTVGAIANQAPELFKAIDAHVPFVDCLTTMLDPTLPLTVTEWEEWGNPVEDPEIYFAMKSYTPYDNVREGVRYPDILATAGLSDPRVGFWEPAKWVQRLRAASPESRVLLRTEMGAGHGGPSDRYESWKEEAMSVACMLDSLGMADT